MEILEWWGRDWRFDNHGTLICIFNRRHASRDIIPCSTGMCPFCQFQFSFGCGVGRNHDRWGIGDVGEYRVWVIVNVSPFNLTANHPLFRPLFRPLFWWGNIWPQLRIRRWKEPFVICGREGAGRSCRRLGRKFVSDKF